MVVSLRLLRWLPVILVTGTLCASASVPAEYIPKVLHHGIDKIVHGIVYALLAASYLYGFNVLGKRFPFRISLATGLICMIYAFGEEWYQQFVPGRIADRFDLRADIIGFLIIIILWLTVTLLQKRSE